MNGCKPVSENVWWLSISKLDWVCMSIINIGYNDVISILTLGQRHIG